jgi:hypothetical protein
MLFIFSYESIATDYEIETELNEFNSTDIESDDDYNNSEYECSIDTFIDGFLNNILPDDYEENKKLEIKYSTKHFNETIAIVKRLHKYSQNVSEKMQPILKRLMPRITDLLLMIDLPPDCMASLVRIGQSVQNGEQWAFKCKLTKYCFLFFSLFPFVEIRINGDPKIVILRL